MAKVYAQHATAGEYHLETRFVDGNWEWWAKAVSNTKLPEYSGSANTLEEATKEASGSIGLRFAKWQNIGPAVEPPG